MEVKKDRMESWRDETMKQRNRAENPKALINSQERIEEKWI